MKAGEIWIRNEIEPEWAIKINKLKLTKENEVSFTCDILDSDYKEKGINISKDSIGKYYKQEEI